MRPIYLIPFAFGLLLTARAGEGEQIPQEKPAAPEEQKLQWAVIKSASEEGDLYEVVARDQASARKKEIRKAVDEAKKEWEKSRNEFMADKSNKGKKFLEDEPASVNVTTAIETVTEEEAQAYVQEKQKDTFAVVRIREINGEKHLDVMAHKAIKPKKKDMVKDFKKALEKWQDTANGWYADPSHSTGFKDPSGVWHVTKIVPFTDLKPIEPEIKIVKGNIPTQDEAEKEMAKLEAGQKPSSSASSSDSGR